MIFCSRRKPDPTCGVLASHEIVAEIVLAEQVRIWTTGFVSTAITPVGEIVRSVQAAAAAATAQNNAMFLVNFRARTSVIVLFG